MIPSLLTPQGGLFLTVTLSELPIVQYTQGGIWEAYTLHTHTGRHMGGIHPYIHPQGGIWKVYTPIYTLREAYGGTYPYIHPQGGMW